METVKLRHFSEYQKTYLIACIANGLSIKESVGYFQDVFPQCGAGRDQRVLDYKVARRISDIKRKSSDEIEAYREVSKHSEIYKIAHLPMIYAEVREHYFQRLFDALPADEVSLRLKILRYVRNVKDRKFPLQETLEHVRDGLSVFRSGEAAEILG